MAPKKEPPIPATVRNSVWLKYNGRTHDSICFCCGLEPISKSNFECGHVISKHNGGDVHLNNLRPICSLCNKSMKTMDMDVFMYKYGYDNKTWSGPDNKTRSGLDNRNVLYLNINTDADINDLIGNFVNDCLVITKNKNDRIMLSLLSRLINDNNESGLDEYVSINSIYRYLKNRKIRVITTGNYKKCPGMRFKDYNVIKEKLRAKSVNELIDLGMIRGEKLEDSETSLAE